MKTRVSLKYFVSDCSFEQFEKNSREKRRILNIVSEDSKLGLLIFAKSNKAIGFSLVRLFRFFRKFTFNWIFYMSVSFFNQI